MKQSEFLRWLIENGVKTEEGTRHTKLYYNGKQSTLDTQGKKLELDWFVESRNN